MPPTASDLHAVAPLPQKRIQHAVTAPTVAPLRNPPMPDYTLQLFAPLVGSTFQLLLDGQPVQELTLAEAVSLPDPRGGRDPSVRSDPFSLSFNGPLSPYAQQATYDLRHAELGDLQIFIVPIGPDPARTQMQYHAVFN